MKIKEYKFRYVQNIIGSYFYDKYDHRKIVYDVIRDEHGRVHTIVFSVFGSPPKGNAFLFRDSEANEWFLWFYSFQGVFKKYSCKIVLKDEEEMISYV